MDTPFFGISSLLSRELAKPDTETAELFGAGVVGASLVALVLTAIAAAVGVIAFSGRPETRLLVCLLLPTIPLTALFAVISAVFIARSRNDIRAIFDVLSSALVLAGVFIIISHHASMGAYAVLQSGAAAVMALLAMATVSFYYRASPRRGIRRVVATARSAVPLGISQVLNVIYWQLDTLLVAAFLSTAMVAWFGLASQIAGFFGAIPGMVNVAATPHFMCKGEAERQRLAQQLVDALASLGVLIALAGVLFSREALLLIGGNKFLGATNALRILFVASSVGFVTSTVQMVVFLLGKQRALVKISFYVLLANIAGNLVAIPLFGIDGAATALLVSELLALGYAVFILRKSTGYSLTFKSVAAYVALACIVGGVYGVIRLPLHLPTTGPWVIAEAAALTGVDGFASECLRRKRAPRPARMLD
jgi:O-antigen/teichoic acid export membrane protein